MSRPPRLLLSLVLLLASCTPPPPASTAPSPSHAPPPAAESTHGAAAPPGDKRLRSRDSLLFITAPPDTYKRGELLYVLDPQPIHGTTRLRIGLVQVVEPRPVKVAWYCKPRAPIDAALAGDGLPVEDFVPDTTVRVGKCWGRYTPPQSSPRNAGSVVDLDVNLGEGDGVRADDLFEILGPPIVDKDNRTVLGFEPLGRCTAVPFTGTPLTSVCRLDLTSWPQFNSGVRPEGGFVRLIQEAPVKP